ncbi:MAG: hypothetical protein F6J98_20095 [Moorea sp. SIO4G2]|uniref:hypothetical protein n=1 Tax=Moorena TaxID=1155738 RepID=UPI0013016148|nr:MULTISPECIES: hypothetical protein [Moorena]NEO14817.1 hypothetical protein [Moorena sp. SIO3E8]NEO62609.1 hypothetical protein [Moorena sp. SIO4G2]NEP28429.1 hypothetical protein [Moorena sp. SIO3I6]NEP97686.1 hypothetical protein [Moorena sp. SIO3F7]
MAIPTDDLSNLEKLAGVVVNLIEAELNEGASQDVICMVSRKEVCLVREGSSENPP